MEVLAIIFVPNWEWSRDREVELQLDMHSDTKKSKKDKLTIYSSLHLLLKTLELEVKDHQSLLSQLKWNRTRRKNN